MIALSDAERTLIAWTPVPRTVLQSTGVYLDPPMVKVAEPEPERPIPFFLRSEPCA